MRTGVLVNVSELERHVTSLGSGKVRWTRSRADTSREHRDAGYSSLQLVRACWLLYIGGGGRFGMWGQNHRGSGGRESPAESRAGTGSGDDVPIS